MNHTRACAYITGRDERKERGLSNRRGGYFPLVFLVDSLATSFISLFVFSLDPPRRRVCSCCSDRRLVDSIRSARMVCCAFADNSPIVFVASFQCPPDSCL